MITIKSNLVREPILVENRLRGMEIEIKIKINNNKHDFIMKFLLK